MSASEFEGHEALVAQLREGTLDAPEHLHRRVLALGPGNRVRVPRSPRRRLFVLVPVAAGLAVGAAVIHGLVTSGSNPTTHVASGVALHGVPSSRHGRATGVTGANGPSGLTGPAGPAGPSGPAGAEAPTGFGMEGAKSVDSRKLARLYSDEAAPALNGSSTFNQSAITIPKNRKVHADTTLDVVVPSRAALTHATNEATQIVTRLGGYTQSSQLQSSSKDGSASISLRVPVGKTEIAIEKLGALGKVVAQSVSTQDLQQRFSKQTDTIGRLRRAIKIYEQTLLSSSLTYTQRINLQIGLANAQHELKRMLTSRSYTAKYAATADIQLTLSTNQHAFAVPPGKRGRFGRLLHNAGDFLALEGIIVLYVLIVAAPLVLLGALGLWLSRERRRREERLLANA